MLQLRLVQPFIIGIERHIPVNQHCLNRHVAVLAQTGLGVLFAHAGLGHDHRPLRTEDYRMAPALVGHFLLVWLTWAESQPLRQPPAPALG